MDLSSKLVTSVARAAAGERQPAQPRTYYGTVASYDGKPYVRLDGSDQLTPVETTAMLKVGDRVRVTVGGHRATVDGNVSSPSAGKGDIDDAKAEIGTKITEVEILVAGKVDTEELNAANGRIDELVTENTVIKGQLTANKAEIDDLTVKNQEVTGKLTAAEGEIDDLKANSLTAEKADLKYATIEGLEATDANIHNLTGDYGEFKKLATDKFAANDASIRDLEATRLTAEQADLRYANIDFANIGKAAFENFFSKSGMIGDLVVGDGTVAGTLVGVTIKGDLIEGGTVVADKLVIKGDDGLFYKLNTDGVSTSAEQTEYNSLSGSILTAKSVTAEKVTVSDLVAFGATIGGFKITEDAIYSGVKDAVGNTTRGTYMDSLGQFAIGDQTNYLRFFLDDADKKWKLEISAAQLKLGSSSQNVEDYIKDQVDGATSGIDALQSSKVEYQAGTSGTTPPTGAWSTAIPTVAAGSYLWTRTTLTYTSGKTVISYGVSRQGADGKPGTPGSAGSAGVGVKSTAVTYQAGASQTAAPTGTWSSGVPKLTTALPYLWTRTVIAYTNGTSSTSYSVGSTVDGLSIGGRNRITQSNFPELGAWHAEGDATITLAESDAVGTYAVFRFTDVYNSSGGTDRVYHGASNAGYAIVVEKGQEYTLSFYGNATAAIKIATAVAGTYNRMEHAISVGWKRYSRTFTAEQNGSVTFTGVAGMVPTNFEITKVQLEAGNKATDWNLAPEDVQSDIDGAHDEASEANGKIDAQIPVIEEHTASIGVLEDTIASLVTDENGSSLMTQTSDGWRFDISSIQRAIDDAAADIDAADRKMDTINQLADTANRMANDVAKKTAYITMKTDSSGKPVMELGETNSPFKVRITNTSIDFLQGSQKIAYITNHQLYIESSVVTDELMIGEGTGWIWKRRDNGNLGLRYI